MKVTVNQDFPATIDRLWEVFSDKEYPRAKYEALGATYYECAKFVATSELIEVDLTRKFPIDSSKIPAIARKFISAEQTMRHETRWQRISSELVKAELKITPVGRPIKITAAGKITPTSTGSRLVLELDVTCDVPLVGGEIAKFFAKQVEQAMPADHAFTLKYLEQANQTKA